MSIYSAIYTDNMAYSNKIWNNATKSMKVIKVAPNIFR